MSVVTTHTADLGLFLPLGLFQCLTNVAEVGLGLAM